MINQLSASTSPTNVLSKGWRYLLFELGALARLELFSRCALCNGGGC